MKRKERDRATLVRQRKEAETQRNKAEEQRKLAEIERNLAEKQRQEAETQRIQADQILANATTIIVGVQNKLDENTLRSVFALLQAGADHGDLVSMTNLGMAYKNGWGVAKNYNKAREWYERAVRSGHEARHEGARRKLYELGSRRPSGLRQGARVV